MKTLIITTLATLVLVPLAQGAVLPGMVAAPSANGPVTPSGKTVKPTVSYTYDTFAVTGEAMIVRVPIRGKRKATLRFGGVMGSPDAGPVGFLGNMDPGSGGIWCIKASGIYYAKAYDPDGYYLVQPVIWYSDPWCRW